MRLAALLQVLSGRYDEKVDVSTLVALHELTMFLTGMGGMRQKARTKTWSIGVIAFLLLSGKHPFTGRTVEQACPVKSPMSLASVHQSFATLLDVARSFRK